MRLSCQIPVGLYVGNLAANFSFLREFSESFLDYAFIHANLFTHASGYHVSIIWISVNNPFRACIISGEFPVGEFQQGTIQPSMWSGYASCPRCHSRLQGCAACNGNAKKNQATSPIWNIWSNSTCDQKPDHSVWSHAKPVSFSESHEFITSPLNQAVCQDSERLGGWHWFGPIRIWDTLIAKNQGNFDLSTDKEPSGCSVIARTYQIGEHRTIFGNWARRRSWDSGTDRSLRFGSGSGFFLAAFVLIPLEPDKYRLSE